MRRVVIAAALVVVLSGLSGRTALAGSAPGKGSGTAARVPAGVTGVGRSGPGSDPAGKLAKVCPKYPGKYSACTPPPTPVPVRLASPVADVCPSGCRFSSLADALAGTPSGGTIRLAPGTYAGGVVIAKSVTLVGAGAGVTVIRGGGPVLTIPAEITVVLSGVTITGGMATGEVPPVVGAGGIMNHGTLTVIASGVSGNRTMAGAGGIYNDFGATLTLVSSIVGGNGGAATYGGIVNFGTASLDNSRISGNAGVQSGGIFSYGAMTVTNSSVSGNSGLGGGGGIWNNFGTMTLTNSTVSGNTGGIAGGIFNTYGTVTLTGSTVSGNIPNNCSGPGTFNGNC